MHLETSGGPHMSLSSGTGRRETTGKNLPMPPFHTCAPSYTSSGGSETRSWPGDQWAAARRPSPASGDDRDKGWSGTLSPVPAAGCWWRPFSPSWRRAFLCLTSRRWLMQEKAHKEDGPFKASATYLTSLSWRRTSSASKAHVYPQPINLGQSRALSSSVYSLMLETLYKTGCLLCHVFRGSCLPKKQSGGNIWRHYGCLTGHINHSYTRKQTCQIPISVT